MPASNLVADVPEDGALPPNLTVKQLKRGAAALKTFGISVHIDYQQWEKAIAASEGTSSAAEQAPPAEPIDNDDEDGASTAKTTTEVTKEARQRSRSHASSVQCRDKTTQSLAPLSTWTRSAAAASSNRLPSSNGAPLFPTEVLPDLPARIKPPRSDDNSHLSHKQQQHTESSSPSSPQSQHTDVCANITAAKVVIKSVKSVGAASEVVKTSSSSSILKKAPTPAEDASSTTTLSPSKKRGKMVRIATSTTRPRRQSSPKPPNMTGGSIAIGPKNLQQSARHAQDYRSSYVFDRHRQQEEMRSRRLLAEDLVRKEILAQREADRVLQVELELQYYRAIQECQKKQEDNLRRIEEHAKLLREYHVLSHVQNQNGVTQTAVRGPRQECKKDSEETLRASGEGEQPKAVNFSLYAATRGNREGKGPDPSLTRAIDTKELTVDVDADAARQGQTDFKPRSRSLPRPRSAHLKRRGSTFFGFGFRTARQSCDEAANATDTPTIPLTSPFGRGRSPVRGMRSPSAHRQPAGSPDELRRAHGDGKHPQEVIGGTSHAALQQHHIPDEEETEIEVGTSAIEKYPLTRLPTPTRRGGTHSPSSEPPPMRTVSAEELQSSGCDASSSGEGVVARGRGGAQRSHVGKKRCGCEKNQSASATNRVICWAAKKLRSRGAQVLEDNTDAYQA